MITSEPDISYFYDDIDRCVKYRWVKHGSSFNPQACHYMADTTPESIIAALRDAYDMGRNGALSDVRNLLKI